MSDKKPIGYPKGKPWSEERMKRFYESGNYEKYSARMRELAVNKTPEQREKMSQAKLGVPKSDEHRASMSKAHKERWARFYKARESHPDMDYRDIWKLLREEA